MSGRAVSDGAGVGPEVSEAQLVERAQRGDPQAFDQLVRRHQHMVFAVAVRMLGDRDEAQDAAQEVFVSAFRALKMFRRQAAFSTWLVAMAMNQCRNRRRWWSRRRRLIVASLDDEASSEEGALQHQVPDPGPSPARVAERRDHEAILMGALQQLDERSRSVVVLRDLHGASYEEMAHALGCRVGTEKSRLNRARLQLRALLDGRLA